jgi:hypothetical protein
MTPRECHFSNFRVFRPLLSAVPRAERAEWKARARIGIYYHLYATMAAIVAQQISVEPDLSAAAAVTSWMSARQVKSDAFAMGGYQAASSLP